MAATLSLLTAAACQGSGGFVEDIPAPTDWWLHVVASEDFTVAGWARSTVTATAAVEVIVPDVGVVATADAPELDVNPAESTVIWSDNAIGASRIRRYDAASRTVETVVSARAVGSGRPAVRQLEFASLFALGGGGIVWLSEYDHVREGLVAAVMLTAGGETRELARFDDVAFVEVSPGQSMVAVAAARRDGDDGALWVIDLVGNGGARRVWDGTLAPDRRHALVAGWFEARSRRHSVESNLWMVDMETLEARNLTPPASVTSESGRFLPGGEQVVFVADEGIYRARIGGVPERLNAEGTWAYTFLEGFAVDASSNVLFFEGRGAGKPRLVSVAPDGTRRVVANYPAANVE